MKFILITLSVFMITACNTSQQQASINPKYDFPYLERVNQIYSYNQASWQTIDDRSLIVRSKPSDYYLLILNSPIPQLDRAIGINITTTSGRVQAGFDSVSILERVNISSPIRLIYKLDNSEQIDEIKAQITASE